MHEDGLIGLAILTGLGFGLAPLWHAGRASTHGLLHATARDDRARVRQRVRATLVIGQVSLTTLLLVGAGLLTQSLVRLQQVPVGVTADSVLTAQIALTRARLRDGVAIDEFLSRVTTDLQSAPGIRSAGISSAIPLGPGAHTITQATAEADPFVTCEGRLVDAGYFRTLQIPLLHGRLFGSQDGSGAPRVWGMTPCPDRYRHAHETIGSWTGDETHHPRFAPGQVTPQRHARHQGGFSRAARHHFAESRQHAPRRR